MFKLLPFTRKPHINTSTAKVPVLSGQSCLITLTLNPKDTSGIEVEKAALLIVHFLDSKDQPLPPSPELSISSKGDPYRYIHFRLGEVVKCRLNVPGNAASIAVRVQPWKMKSFSIENLEIISEKKAGLRYPASIKIEPAPTTPAIVSDTHPIQDLEMRNWLEATLAEASREKASFSGKVEIPSENQLENASQFSLARNYARRPQVIQSKKRHLIISTSYPDKNNLYANAFVHSRAKAYVAEGVAVDVLVFARGSSPKTWEHDGIQVLSGYASELIATLMLTEYQSVSIHFMHPHMWPIMRELFSLQNFFIFIHGYEVRNWIRAFDLTLGIEGAKREKARTDLNRDMWQDILKFAEFPSGFIFVSDWMRRAAEDDVMMAFPREKTHIIHNPIDTEYFSYCPKSPADARNILIIRNFDKYLYATDLIMKSMIELKQQNIWKDLKFTIYGAGARLGEFQSEFSPDNNVEINDGYLSHEQIRDAHRKHGVILIPTRLDSQGVSRDEAMASGLVPITNASCAVPEFVDENCAIIAPHEDYHQLAKGIVELATTPEKFLKMSAAAATRVRVQSPKQSTIAQEMNVLGLLKSAGS